MSLEYAMGGVFSEKSDVYSFGVLLLEIVSGRKTSYVFDSEGKEGPLSLVGHVSIFNDLDSDTFYLHIFVFKNLPTNSENELMSRLGSCGKKEEVPN